MKKLVLMSVVVVVAMLALGVAGLAYAQEPQPTEPVPFGQNYGRGGMMGRGGGMMGRWSQGATGQYGPMHEYMVGAMAEALGLTVDELNAELAAGKTMWQVAEAQGLSLEDFQQLMLDARNVALDKMVADGVLTPEQAEWMKSRMQGRLGQGGALGGCPMYGGASGGRWGTPSTAPSTNG